MDDEQASPPRRRANTRARLLEAAVDVFARNGVASTTVDDLVAAAGYTRGAFYSNFSSMDEVFYALFEARSSEMLEAVRQALAAIPREELSPDSVGRVIDAIEPAGRRWHILQAEFSLLAMRKPEARAAYRAFRSRFSAEFLEVTREALAAMGRRPVVPVEQIAEALAAIYVSSLTAETIEDDTLRPREALRSLVPAVLVGLSREGTDGEG
ncbi:TetR/AcrR family transcriptional regulator [Georgenia thermotolerans]|uniref:TetR/AcrR family transcriptional regulator n=1 Tax=Georgenia thermotolerans TaxID=527326 RepID=UPI0014790FF8|nr:TetR/AcrR family transcriptional regulator [Georgenia thermotolerans]